ncbi:GxxExxY protein [candidate division KSB1 bacterium]|nr:GxxExxY protein [candidate division KSB1 bacterium]
MPIKHAIQNMQISDEEYHSFDYEIMRLVFSIHRDLGRFWNEKIYQNELAYRCEKAGIKPVYAEVPIEVTFEDFKKIYYLDLLINNIIYELKTVQTLSGEHQKQTINYLLLTGLKHAKLVNLRPKSVEYQFITTKITPEKRFNFSINDDKWLDLDEDSAWFRDKFKKLLTEWGVFLDINLFYEAITY